MTRAVDIEGRGVRVNGRSVGVGSAIPDIVENRWPADGGSGQTLANNRGSVGMSLNFDNWVTGQYAGDTAPSFDGSDDIGYTDSQIDINGPEVFAATWINNISTGSLFTGLFNLNNSASTIGSGWEVFFDESDAELTLRHVNAGTRNDVIKALSIPDASTTQLFVAVGIDGDNGELWVYDKDQQRANATGTGTREQSSSEYLGLMAGVGGHTAGVADDITTATTKLTESKVEDVWGSTGPNA